MARKETLTAIDQILEGKPTERVVDGLLRKDLAEQKDEPAKKPEPKEPEKK